MIMIMMMNDDDDGDDDEDDNNNNNDDYYGSSSSSSNNTDCNNDNDFKTAHQKRTERKKNRKKERKIGLSPTLSYAYRWRDSRNCPEKAVTFSDGTPMPEDVMDDLDQVFDDAAVAVTWQKGDVMVVDNRLVLHSRRSFTPPRRILACLAK